jgi:hypothetical protein
MGILWSRLSNNFRDLTHPQQMEANAVPFLSMFSIDDNLAQKYSRDRYQFYANLWEALNSPDPTVVDRVLGIEMKNRAQYEQVNESKRDISSAVRFLKQGGGAPTWFETQLAKLKPAAPAAVPAATAVPGAKPDKDVIYREWKSHPIYSPEVEAVSMTDRIVFIAVTYAFRAITLYLIEWSLHNRMITSFEKAFWYYFFIYVSLFVLLVMLVNIETTSPTLRMMFYYLNTDIRGGWMRIYVHCIAQLLLIIIPFILRETSSATGQAATFLSFEERQNVLSTLSRFTLFMWILTSAIALRI